MSAFEKYRMRPIILEVLTQKQKFHSWRDHWLDEISPKEPNEEIQRELRQIEKIEIRSALTFYPLVLVHIIVSFV
jgi:hypothetical protein